MLQTIGLFVSSFLRCLRTRRSLLLENLVLRQQLAILKRKHPRPRLYVLDKVFWVLAQRFWSGSSAGHQRLGHITKQGSSLLRFLLVEAAQAAARWDAEWRRRYVHLAMRRQKSIAKVAMARRLAVRLYWMWRNGWEYSQWDKFGSNAGQLVTGHGVN